MRILLFGSRGMLGSDLQKEFEDSGHEVMGVDREEVDITHGPNIADVFHTIEPEVVINATGYTDVDGAETNREAAFALNSEAVKYLAEAAAAVSAKFVHISTEMVFDGDNKSGYNETTEPHAVNVYGESKAAGEKHVLVYESGGYLVRTSWLYGKFSQRGKPRGLNFIETMIKLANEKPEVKVVNDQFGKLTSTKDLAQAITQLISGGYIPGIYHLVNEGVASWYDVAKEIWQRCGLKATLQPISSSEYPSIAKRPKYSVLVNTKFPPLRPWQQALADYLS
ncbi:MAG: dTDP-4-dehydrorhamnose reductase [Parcubacteria group bacterium GW2011_GWE1_43_8]|uniref:dTDP-4-dehydrorhamnose reductase n=2 Tax=Candidatus Vebleniibacteriota TaxID=1817921 RepID=A0A1G2Q854_9BACT|nr:MAG: dTDP-4-dehydrorhamnose reductase [Parcubacteria group bacterium GW2011_GWE1_43_8]OHA55858.1 MAG: dTDP-4-dehydrorhamnose reductase [Candidatus Veblenbacteria bacterium RIFOXYB1_FULL_43_13]OHA56726.1 MAG: dTDP-4-dehydrorhamnose reductase [Candidatus Veblenbacteria bacterium RIFOXYD1_FULL_43_11]HBZ36205.1 dTDP-4-dehydrorhamnose reductase [Candidatus Veblenbacteria bacterium]HCM45268.1 dTDP-4-dehydrorhamnose reductase [Candidatus Veblenbacteria bacterium]